MPTSRSSLAHSGGRWKRICDREEEVGFAVSQECMRCSASNTGLWWPPPVSTIAPKRIVSSTKTNHEIYETMSRHILPDGDGHSPHVSSIRFRSGDPRIVSAEGHVYFTAVATPVESGCCLHTFPGARALHSGLPTVKNSAGLLSAYLSENRSDVCDLRIVQDR